MKSELKSKLFQYLLNEKINNQGFTLIELLVVIIIIGILAAISLPSFLNQTSKARQSEAKTYMSTMIRSQQVYYIEKQQFAAGVGYLALGFNAQTANYTYTINGGGFGATAVTNQAQPRSSVLKAYIGGVSISNNIGVINDATALATLCEALLPTGSFGANGTETFGAGFTPSAAPTCPTGGQTGYATIN